MLRTDSTCSALRRHAVVALTRRTARRERGRSYSAISSALRRPLRPQREQACTAASSTASLDSGRELDRVGARFNLDHHAVVALTRRVVRWKRRRRLLSFISRQDRELGDLGRSRARGWTWTRRGMRELMSIITPSRFWRGVGREGSATATYSPFISRRDRDLGRSRAISGEMSDMDSTWSA